MACPTLSLSNCCCGAIDKLHHRNLVGAIGCLFDILATITCVVVGILGATAVIPKLGPAASYSLIGIGSAIPLLYGITFLVKSCICNR